MLEANEDTQRGSKTPTGRLQIIKERAFLEVLNQTKVPTDRVALVSTEVFGYMMKLFDSVGQPEKKI